MAKKNKNNNTDWTSILIVLILGIVVLSYTGVLDLSDLGFGTAAIVNGDVDLDEDYEPEETYTSCTEYDIAEEYRNALGTTNYLAFITGCNNNGGIFTSQANQVSCYWDPAVGTIDCNTATMGALEMFCEDTLHATWYCDNSIAFVGCLCRTGVPSAWDTGEGDGQDNGDNEEGEITYCEDIDAQTAFENGVTDLGTYCSDNGYCAGTIFNCAHYWDYTLKEHHCGCTESFFCVASNCHEYLYTVDCECPPNSWREVTSRSTFRCVPNGYSCESGSPEPI